MITTIVLFRRKTTIVVIGMLAFILKQTKFIDMRQFQKLFGLVILTIILASFKFDNGFIIKGHIDGIEDGIWVKLYDLDQQIYLDSALSKKGNFILKGRVEYPTTCWVKCNNEYAIVQVENTEITFNSPIKDMHLNSNIQGGREQELQNELKKLQQPYDILYFSAYDSLMNNKFSNDSEKQRLIKKFNESQSTSQEIYVNFGKKHPNSYLGIGIIYSNRESISKDSLKLIYESILPEFKETSKAKALKIYLYEELTGKGKPFIDFKVKSINGENFILSSLKGKYIYLTFWSAGCGYCRMENRLISKNLNELPKDLSLVNFSIDKNIKAWDIASKSDSIIWYNVSDLEGGTGKIKTKYQVQGTPTSFLIDKDGIIVEKFDGFDKDIIKRLKALIEEKKNER
jgi:thiol-disulfide isomerase/thioredoxin